jgi:hypothetical protein
MVKLTYDQLEELGKLAPRSRRRLPPHASSNFATNSWRRQLQVQKLKRKMISIPT